MFGVCGPQDRIEVSPFEIYRRDLTIVGSFAIRRTYDRAFKLMEHGRIKVEKPGPRGDAGRGAVPRARDDEARARQG